MWCMFSVVVIASAACLATALALALCRMVAMTAALTRIAEALERLPVASLAALKAEFDDASAGAGETSPAEAFRGLREEFGQYYDDVELLE